jgi:hypothetical protein
VNCGSYANTFTYTGVKNPSGISLSYTTDLIDIDRYTGQIKIAAAKTVGTY